MPDDPLELDDEDELLLDDEPPEELLDPDAPDDAPPDEELACPEPEPDGSVGDCDVSVPSKSSVWLEPLHAATRTNADGTR